MESILGALISSDEYTLAKELSSLDSDRQTAIKAIAVLESVIRDASAAKFGGIAMISPMQEKAAVLSKNVRIGGLEKMYSACKEATDKISQNANLGLTLADLACKLKSYSVM